MANSLNVLTSFVQETRREKESGLYSIALRVTHQRAQKYYGLGRLGELIKNLNKVEPGTVKWLLDHKEFTVDEWGKINGEKPRGKYKDIALELAAIENKVNSIIKDIQDFSFKAFEKKVFNTSDRDCVFIAFENAIAEYYQNDQAGTASNYQCSLNSLKAYANNDLLKFSDIHVEFLEKYEKWMIEKGKSLTTVGIYLRPLRALFKKSGAKNYPFKDYVIPGKTNKKKALDNDALKKIFEYTPISKAEQKTLDFWKFSFLCKGINLADIANLKFFDIEGDRFSFIRQKTARTKKDNQKVIEVYLHPVAKEIIARQGNKMSAASDYVFPIYSEGMTSKEKHLKRQNFVSVLNHSIKRIAKKIGITQKVSFYFARHSFATKLMKENVSIEYISKSLGHQDYKTTENYLASFEQSYEQEITNNLTNF